MKPGNLAFKLRCQIRRQREMRIRYTHIESVGVRFLFFGSAPKDLYRWISGSFRATRRHENLEIHKVFLRFPWLDLHENLSLTMRQISFRTDPDLCIM